MSKITKKEIANKLGELFAPKEEETIKVPKLKKFLETFGGIPETPETPEEELPYEEKYPFIGRK